MTQSTVLPVSKKSRISRTARRSANAIVVFPEHGDYHIPYVSIIIDDENVFPLAHHLPTTGGPSIQPFQSLIVTTIRQYVGNVHYRHGGRRLDFYWYVLGR